jgi:hypothetical protein
MFCDDLLLYASSERFHPRPRANLLSATLARPPASSLRPPRPSPSAPPRRHVLKNVSCDTTWPAGAGPRRRRSALPQRAPSASRQGSARAAPRKRTRLPSWRAASRGRARSISPNARPRRACIHGGDRVIAPWRTRLGASTRSSARVDRPVCRERVRAPQVREHAQLGGRVRAHPGRWGGCDAAARCGQRERARGARDGRAPSGARAPVGRGRRGACARAHCCAIAAARRPRLTAAWRPRSTTARGDGPHARSCAPSATGMRAALRARSRPRRRARSGPGRWRVCRCPGVGTGAWACSRALIRVRERSLSAVSPVRDLGRRRVRAK